MVSDLPGDAHGQRPQVPTSYGADSGKEAAVQLFSLLVAQQTISACGTLNPRSTRRGHSMKTHFVMMADYNA